MHRARRLDHWRARRRRRKGAVHGQHVHRRRPRLDATRPLRVRSGRSSEPGQGVPDAAVVRRAARRARRRSGARFGDRSGEGGRRDRRRRTRGVVMTTAATDAVRDALQRACGTDAVRPAGHGDEVGGRSPRWVAAPADTAALAALVRACAEHELAMVARGEGGKLDWGNPPRRVDVLIDMGRLAGLYRHDADDLVATVGAGTPLRAVQAALAKRNQRLAMDPGSADATIGGMLAVGEAGPLGLGYGTPRDQLIGVEFVRTDGVIGHSGGRVVKNVAGYDLGKLLAGSYGTLALMTSATFRVHPRPMARAFVSRPVTSPLEAHDIVLALLGSGLAPAAIELDLPVINPGAVPPMVSRPTPGRPAMPGGS